MYLVLEINDMRVFFWNSLLTRRLVAEFTYCTYPVICSTIYAHYDLHMHCTVLSHWFPGGWSPRDRRCIISTGVDAGLRLELEPLSVLQVLKWQPHYPYLPHVQ